MFGRKVTTLKVFVKFPGLWKGFGISYFPFRGIASISMTMQNCEAEPTYFYGAMRGECSSSSPPTNWNFISLFICIRRIVPSIKIVLEWQLLVEKA